MIFFEPMTERGRKRKYTENVDVPFPIFTAIPNFLHNVCALFVEGTTLRFLSKITILTFRMISQKLYQYRPPCP